MSLEDKKSFILYIEDDLDLSGMYKDMLEEEIPGVHVDQAKNGLEGLSCLRENSYFLIISDFKMPQMNGLEFLEKSAQEFGGKRPMVIFSSGYTGSIEGKELDSSKFENVIFLDKPFDPDHLVRKIKLILHTQKGTLSA